MSWRQNLAEEPWRHDMLRTLALIEALNPDKPRLGDSAVRREEYLDLGQVPFIDFPASNVASFDPKTERGKHRIRVKFMGLLGPMGPLPSSLTEEALAWFAQRDDAFVRFLDIFNNRFLQLFYRAHADARPSAHLSRPDQDRFSDYVGSTIGLGSEAWHGLDSMPDHQKLGFAGVLSMRGASASRVESLVMGVFGVKAEVDQFVGSYLRLPKEERTRLGQAHSGFGDGALLGEQTLVLESKFRLRIFPETLERYEKFLPEGAWSDRLIDAVQNAVGLEYEWDVELVLPVPKPKPTCLGSYGELGWTSWMRSPTRDPGKGNVRTRFVPRRQNSRRKS